MSVVSGYWSKCCRCSKWHYRLGAHRHQRTYYFLCATGWAPTAIVAPVGAVGVFFNGIIATLRGEAFTLTLTLTPTPTLTPALTPTLTLAPALTLNPKP